MLTETFEAGAPPEPVEPRALPGLWHEVGGLDCLVRLDAAPRTPGMCVVALAGEDWQRRPELRWQAWPDDLERMNGAEA